MSSSSRSVMDKIMEREQKALKKHAMKSRLRNIDAGNFLNGPLDHVIKNFTNLRASMENTGSVNVNLHYDREDGDFYMTYDIPVAR